VAAFGAIGEYATTEFDRTLVVAIHASDIVLVAIADLGRAFAPAQMGQGDVIEIGPEDRKVLVPPPDQDVTRDDLSGG
jgi:hypothetical protein